MLVVGLLTDGSGPEKELSPYFQQLVLFQLYDVKIWFTQLSKKFFTQLVVCLMENFHQTGPKEGKMEIPNNCAEKRGVGSARKNVATVS